jgi:hypothetical protein
MSAKPLVHFRVTPVADDAEAILPYVRAFPYKSTDLVGGVFSVPIEPGTIVEGVILKTDVGFDAASVDVGDAADPNGFVAAGACTPGFVSSLGSAAAYSAVGGKLYTTTSVLKVTYADAVTAGAGTLYVKMLSL